MLGTSSRPIYLFSHPAQLLSLCFSPSAAPHCTPLHPTAPYCALLLSTSPPPHAPFTLSTLSTPLTPFTPLPRLLTPSPPFPPFPLSRYSQVGRQLLERIEGSGDMHACIVDIDQIYPGGRDGRLPLPKHTRWPDWTVGKSLTMASWGAWKARPLGVRGSVVHQWKARTVDIDGLYVMATVTLHGWCLMVYCSGGLLMYIHSTATSQHSQRTRSNWLTS